MIDHVIWPEKYHPKVSPLYALNDGDVKAPPEIVWKLLVDCEHWASWFPYENQVKILTGEKELKLGTVYSRKTLHFDMRLTVTECVPFRRLAWSTVIVGDGTGSGAYEGASAYHGWVITPTKDGCHVLHEETQQGEYMIEELARQRPGGLYAYHQEWTEHLEKAAEAEAAKLGA